MWRSYLEKIFLAFPSAEYVLMLHNQPEFLQFLQSEIIQFFQGMNFVYRSFSGGEGYIYFREERDTGLLLQKKLVKNRLAFPNRRICSVLDEADQIYDKYFDGVWQYYRYNVIREYLIEVQEKIFQSLPIDHTHEISLKAYFKSHPKITDYYNHISPKVIQKLTLGLKTPEKFWISHQALFDHFEADLSSPNYLEKLNRLFSEAIELWGEDIY